MFRTLSVGALVIGAVAAACQEPDPNYGDPSGIIGKKLPGESTATTGSSGTPAADGGPATSGTVAPPTTPTITVAAAHADGGGPAEPITADCLSCHGAGPTPAKFVFGGLISNSKAAIVAVDGLNPVATDTDGYFWSKEANPMGASVTISSSSGGSQKMGGLTPTTGGGCLAATACHGAAQPGPITL